jgi:hypothetical protein
VTTLTEPLTHAQREAQAYNEAMTCARVGDRVGHAKAWAEYRRLHAERPRELVNVLERLKGLA